MPRTAQSRQSGRTAHSAITTQDHDEIRRWAEERQGKPATVASTGRGGEEAGILRIDFPPYGNQGKLEDISWDDWFQKFDEMGLQFLYQDRKADGEQSTFNKLVSAESAKAKSGTSRSGSSRASGSRSTSRSSGRSNSSEEECPPEMMNKKSAGKAVSSSRQQGSRSRSSGTRSSSSEGRRMTAQKSTSARGKKKSSSSGRSSSHRSGRKAA